MEKFVAIITHNNPNAGTYQVGDDILMTWIDHTHLQRLKQDLLNKYDTDTVPTLVIGLVLLHQCNN